LSDFTCGYVALIGIPNAGKSTLLNRILGEKLAITSSKPQTTRNRIVGIHNDERTQMVLIDTPGIHRAWSELNRSMVRAAMAAIDEVDAVCWIGDMTVLARRVEDGQPVLDEVEEEIAAALEKTGRPVVFAANKIDVVPKQLLLPVIEAFHKRIKLVASVPISALTGDGVDELVAELRGLLPGNPPMFPTDQWTEHSERFLVAEIIREKVFHLTEQEIPYSTFVDIEKFDEEERESQSLVRIFARVVVERPSQKGIVIGKGGEMIKRIGTLARQEIQKVLGCSVYLELFVAVEKDWTKSPNGIRKAGIDGDR
jgi:GTP-binding protein Era